MIQITEEATRYNNILQFGKRSWAMKPYAAYRWGDGMPCPLRFVVNPYQGCDFSCQHCYSWYRFGHSSQRAGDFRKSLKHDIQRAKNFGLGDLLVMISSSTDPFQPIEKEYRDALFSLEELLGEGFPILIMTRNPRMLLEDEYHELIKNEKVFINVTIASLHEKDPQSIFYGPKLPPLSEKIDAIKELIKIGKEVKIKIEPVVPSKDGIQGQTEEELWELVKILKDAGIKMIISKTMRLNKEVPPYIYDKLFSYYNKNGSIGGVNRILSKSIRKQLLTPVYDACKHYGIPFCPCVETDLFPRDETFRCSSIYEKVPPIMSVIRGLTEGKKQKDWQKEEKNHIHGC